MKEKIVEYLGPKIADFFFDGITDKVKENKKNSMEKRALQHFQEKLENEVLERYGNEMFYDDLCKAMMKNSNLERVLKRCKNRLLTDDKDDSEVISEIMRGMNIQLYNYDNVKSGINYIMQQAFLSFNELVDVENIKLKNIIMLEGDKVQNCVKAVQKDFEKILVMQDETASKMDQLMCQQETILSNINRNSSENIGELKPSDIKMLESGRYRVKVSAKNTEDYFKILADVKINPREFQYETFNEYIAYLRFAGETANMSVCSFTIVAANGTVVQKYEDTSYSGMKISIPVVYVKEVELGDIEFSSMMVCIKPEFDYQDIQIEGEDGTVFVPTRNYQIRRKIQDGKVCISLVDQSSTGRLLVNYVITVVDIKRLCTTTSVAITQRNENSVSSNLEFYKLLKQLKDADSLIGRDVLKETDVFKSSGFNCHMDTAFEYLDEKIKFYTQLLRLERMYNLHFNVPSVVEYEEIVNVEQITKIINGEIVKTQVGELTIQAESIDLANEGTLEDLAKMQTIGLLFHYQKITVFDVELPITDFVRMVVFAKNIRLCEDGSIKMECYSSYAYNEKVASLSDSEILDNFANGRLLIKE